MSNALALTLLTLFIFSCRTRDYTIANIGNPPGTIKIANNLYFDKTEMANIYYLEFMNWIKNIYGASSTEYLNIVPKSNVWSKLNGDYINLDTFYLNHPAYWYYPVVGISFEQAKIYSKWRSDRVMEYLLIKNKIIPVRPLLDHKDSIFTIEKYFTGQYYGIKPSAHFLIYPFYSLPDSTIYYKAAIIGDSINKKNYKSCREKFCADELLIDCNCLENRKDVNDSRPYGPSPTMETRCVFCRKELITHLKGNLREMTNIRGLFYGSSFYDSCNIRNNTCRLDTNLINSYSGFRNICTYRQWK